jgi:hypothetical protein
MAKRKQVIRDGMKVRGFIRLQIIDDPDGNPRVVGDSGWFENQITNSGFQQINSCYGAVSGSSQVTHAALGTGTVPGASATTLDGEITDVVGARCAVTPSTIASTTVQFAFTLASGVYTTTHTIQNVGLFQTSTTAAGTLYQGKTYATSQLASNQAVNGSFQLRLS